MIKGIRVKRSKVYPFTDDPIQVSKNLQIAINNGTHLTILDPKLPYILRSITSTRDNVAVLETSELYDINSIVNLDQLEQFGIRNHSNLVIESLDETFTLSRIFEPLIVSHKWSAIDPRNKDCYLGVLLNTRELLILQRDSILPGKYKAEFKVFNHMVDQMRLPIEQLSDKGKIHISNDESLRLQIKTFDFSQISDSGQVIDWLSVSNAANEIIIYHLTEGLPRSLSFETSTVNTIKQIWTPWTKGTSRLVLISDKSEIDVYEVYFSFDTGTLSVNSTPSRIVQSSRFTVEHTLLVNVGEKSYLVATLTSYIQVFDLETLAVAKTVPRTWLPVASVVPYNQNDTMVFDVAYECGQFERIEITLSSMTATKTEVPSTLTDFVSNSLQRHKTMNKSSEEDGEDNTEGISTLPLSKEARFVNLGMKFCDVNGMIVALHKAVPKRALNYNVSSQFEFNIDFIPMGDLHDDYKSQPSFSTSIAFINSLLFDQFDDFPQAPKGSDGSDPVFNFLELLQDFKSKNFTVIDKLISDLKTDSHIDILETALATQFTMNNVVLDLQRLYNFNDLQQACLETVKADIPKLTELIEKLKNDQQRIEDSLLSHVITITLNHFEQQDLKLEEYDRYMLINFAIRSQFESTSLPTRSNLVLNSEYVSETFTASSTDDFEDDAVSTTNHKWPRCSLTTLPIIDPFNEVDELRRKNYICRDQFVNGSLAFRILNTLDYCIFSGNKTYNFS